VDSFEREKNVRNCDIIFFDHISGLSKIRGKIKILRALKKRPYEETPNLRAVKHVGNCTT